MRQPPFILIGRMAMPPTWLMPLAVFAIVASAFSGLVWMQYAQRHDVIRLQTSITAEQVAIRLAYYLEVRLDTIDAMSRHLAQGNMTDEATFRQLAENVCTGFPDIQAVNWLDAEGRARWVHPEGSNRPVLQANLKQHPVAGPVLARVDATGLPGVTTPLTLLQGGRGFAAYFPVYDEGSATPRGYVNVALRLRPIITGCLGEDVTGKYAFHIDDGGLSVYDAGTDDEADPAYRASCPLPVMDRTWTLWLSPREHLVAMHDNLTATLVLVLGLALAFALAIDWWRLSRSRKRLQTRTAELLAIYQAYPDMQMRLRRDGTILDCQTSLESKLYVSRDRFIGRCITDVLPAEIAPAFVRAMEESAGRGGLVQFDYRLAFDDVTEHHEARVVPLNDRELIVIVRDITEQKRAEQLQKLMMDELDHRVKNTLTSILALHEQTLASSTSLGAYRERFSGRLIALARTHEALANNRWAGVNVRRLLRETLLTHVVEDGSRVRLAGDDCTLPARVSSVLCLVLHELTTNAIKHGALSAPGGIVEVSWSRDASTSHLDLRWTERVGSPVPPPRTRGVGTSIIYGLVEFQLLGAVQMDFDGSGLKVVLTIPLDDRRTEPAGDDDTARTPDVAVGV